MEPSDLPLIVPIESTIASMFGDALEELGAMRATIAAAEAAARRPQTPEPTPEELAAQAAAQTTAAGGGKGGKGGAAGGGAAAAPKPKAGGKGPVGAAGGKANAADLVTAEELLRQEAERKKKAEEEQQQPPPVDPYRALADEIARDEKAYVEAAAPHLAFARRRLEYFASKPANKYMIEDILGEWVTDAPPETHPGCIDAAQLAHEHTSKLAEKFGYKLPRGLHEVGKVEPAAEDEAATRAMLSTHGAGGVNVEKDFVCRAPFPPTTPKDGTVGSAGGAAAAASTRNSNAAAAAAADSWGAAATPTSPSKSAGAGSAFSQSQRLTRLNAGNASKSIVQRAMEATEMVECSHKELLFTDCLPGHVYESTVTFWNRDINLRLFKLSPMTTSLISVEPITPGYSPETTIAPGCSAQFRVSYRPVNAARIEAGLKLGHTRDSNRIDAEANKLAQWAFLDVPIVCAALEPKLVLLNDAQNVAIADVTVDPTFVFSSTTVTVPVVNLGGAADFTLVIAAPFRVEPPTLTLQNGEFATIAITVSPDESHRELETALHVTGNLVGHSEADGAVHFEWPVISQAVVPSVWLEGIGTATMDAYATNTLTVPDPPLMIVEDACVGFTSQKTVCVRNDSPLPVSFSWVIEQTRECGLAVFPAEGVLAPERSTVFTVEMTPSVGEKVDCLLKLLLHGLPSVPEGHDVPFLSRGKPLPVLAGTNLSDPYQLFGSPVKKPLATAADAVYCCAVRMAADATELAAHVAPTEIANAVPLLIRQPNYREFTVVNACNRELQFWIDPPRGDDHPDAVLVGDAKKRHEKRLRHMRENFGPSFVPPQSFEREGVQLVFTPQRGVIPGNGSVTIGVTFTINFAGPHDIDVECFFPQLTDPAKRSQFLHVTAVARGPSVHASADLIDFGIIPLREEAESRLTLTNHNPIPLTFRCRDALAGPGVRDVDSARYVFLPDSAPLKPGQSVELTVYRRGDVVADVREHFEINVVDGETTFITTCASIQKPRAYVTPSVVNFGEVDRDIPAYKDVTLANLSAVDIHYELIVIDAPRTVTIAMNKPSGVLFAGDRNFVVSLEAVFHGEKPTNALVALHSPQLDEPVPFEVKCDRVNQLSISLDVAQSTTAVAERPPAMYFVRDLLHNIVSTALGDLDANVRAYCEPVVITDAVIPDSEPFCVATAVLSIANHSGCNTKFHVAATHYVPVLPTHPALETTAATTTMNNNTTAIGNGKKGGTLATLNATATQHPGKLTATTKSQLLGATQKSIGAVSRKSATNGATHTVEPAEKKLSLSTNNAAFTCRALDGREKIAQEHETILSRAQNLLLDGKGCAVDLRNCIGDLGGHSLQQVAIELVANLPGRYEERLRVDCDGVPPVELSVTMAVRGRPIVIDPFTSGMAPDPETGINRLLLPSMVGGMSAIKRRLRITSRCPRDLVVTSTLIEGGEFYSLSLVTGSAADGPFDLQLNTASNASNACGTVTPATLTLPALESAEIVVEYKPPAGALGEWRANLILTASLAETPFNDRFLIDEFYFLNRGRYPSHRTVAANSLLQTTANEKFAMRGVPKIMVKSPLIDRPGIVKDSVVVYPDEAQVRMAMHDASAGGDSDDEKDAVHHDAEFERRARELRQRLTGEDAERQELLKYIEQQRVAQRASFAEHLIHTELMIVANNVEPRLVSDPDKMLRFPMVQVGGKCDRTMRLTNPHVTPFDFRVECTEPFRITRAVLVTDDGREKAERDNAGTTSGSKSLLLRKTASTASMASIGAAAGGTSLVDTTFGATRSVNPHSDPTATLFRLHPQQSVAITVELTRFETREKHQVTGELFVNFSNGARQVLPLLATIHVPTLVSEPPMTWFRPSVLLENGRPQPQYQRSIKLVNYSACAAPFSIVHLPADRPISRGTETLTRLQKAQQTLRVTPLQQHALVIDDPSRFALSATSGVVPPATAGGAPGTLDVKITFHESATTTFESKFSVVVEGGAGCEFTVRGESKETEI